MRKNAHKDVFVLPGALTDEDWHFHLITTPEERFFAWKMESKRQIAGEGRAYRALPAAQREKIASQFAVSGNQVDSRHSAPVFEFSPAMLSEPAYKKAKPHHVLLLLDVDCRAGMESILRFIEKRLAGDPVYRSAPKRRAGRRNYDTFRVYLKRLAVTRLVHAYGIERAVEMFNATQPKAQRITAEDCGKFRSATEKELKKIKSQG